MTFLDRSHKAIAAMLGAREKEPVANHFENNARGEAEASTPGQGKVAHLQAPGAESIRKPSTTASVAVQSNRPGTHPNKETGRKATSMATARSVLPSKRPGQLPSEEARKEATSLATSSHAEPSNRQGTQPDANAGKEAIASSGETQATGPRKNIIEVKLHYRNNWYRLRFNADLDVQENLRNLRESKQTKRFFGHLPDKCLLQEEDGTIVIYPDSMVDGGEYFLKETRVEPVADGMFTPQKIKPEVKKECSQTAKQSVAHFEGIKTQHPFGRTKEYVVSEGKRRRQRRICQYPTCKVSTSNCCLRKECESFQYFNSFKAECFGRWYCNELHFTSHHLNPILRQQHVEVNHDSISLSSQL